MQFNHPAKNITLQAKEYEHNIVIEKVVDSGNVVEQIPFATATKEDPQNIDIVQLMTAAPDLLQIVEMYHDYLQNKDQHTLAFHLVQKVLKKVYKK